MKFVPALFFLLPLFLAAAVSANNLEKLQNLVKKHPHEPIRLTAEDYALFTKRPRTYGLFVTLTALGDLYNCGPCKLVLELQNVREIN